MEEKKTIFHYISQLFTTFGIIIVIFVVFGLIIGESAKEYSSLFALGSQGLATGMILQLLSLSTVITILRNIFFTDGLIKNMPLIARNICFFVITTGIIAGYVALFKWFPLSDVLAWVGFFISFAICSAIAIGVSKLKEKAEDKKMEKALEKYRNN